MHSSRRSRPSPTRHAGATGPGPGAARVPGAVRRRAPQAAPRHAAPCGTPARAPGRDGFGRTPLAPLGRTAGTRCAPVRPKGTGGSRSHHSRTAGSVALRRLRQGWLRPDPGIPGPHRFGRAPAARAAPGVHRHGPSAPAVPVRTTPARPGPAALRRLRQGRLRPDPGGPGGRRFGWAPAARTAPGVHRCGRRHRRFPFAPLPHDRDPRRTGVSGRHGFGRTPAAPARTASAGHRGARRAPARPERSGGPRSRHSRTAGTRGAAASPAGTASAGPRRPRPAPLRPDSGGPGGRRSAGRRRGLSRARAAQATARPGAGTDFKHGHGRQPTPWAVPTHRGLGPHPGHRPTS